VRELLQKLADDALAEARKSALALVEALGRDLEDDEVDSHVLDMNWARGERRGYLNALHDLEEAQLMPPVPSVDLSGRPRPRLVPPSGD
jgi:hypothetical protein